MLDSALTKVGQLLICIIAGVFVFVTIFTFVLPTGNSSTIINQSALVDTNKNINGLVPIDSDPDKANSTDPYFSVKGAILDIHDSFDYTRYIVKCQSRDGTDLRPYVSVKNPVKAGVIGTYKVSFLLHWNGQEIVKTTTFRVTDRNNYQ